MSRPPALLEVELDPATGEPRTSHLRPAGRRPARLRHRARGQGERHSGDGTVRSGAGAQPGSDSHPTCSRCAAIFRRNTGATDGYRDA